jgi:hypothetical protein
LIIDLQQQGGAGRAAGKEYLILGAAGGNGLMAGRGTPDRPPLRGSGSSHMGRKLNN